MVMGKVRSKFLSTRLIDEKMNEVEEFIRVFRVGINMEIFEGGHRTERTTSAKRETIFKYKKPEKAVIGFIDY